MEKSPTENTAAATPFSQTYFHGTKVHLEPGQLLSVGNKSNYPQHGQLNHIYFTGTLDAAIWGAELAVGTGKERIYLVEPTGEFEDDPNLTNKKFPGNPTLSFRSQQPLRVIGEVRTWQGHSAEQVNAMKVGLAKLRDEGRDEIIN